MSLDMFTEGFILFLIKEQEKEEILRERLRVMPDWAWAEWVEEQGIGE